MVNFDLRKLDATVRQFARVHERAYYERHREEGMVLRQRYRPEGQGGKGVGRTSDNSDSGGRGRAGRRSRGVSWAKGTGGGTRGRRKGTSE